MRLRLAVLVGLGLLLHVPVSSAQSQDGVFSAKVESVRVDVLVMSGDEPVRGLTQGDFEIFDNGVPQNVELVSFEEIPLNVILALDLSESVAGDRLSQLQRASDALLAQLKSGDQAALVTFSHKVTLAAPLSGSLTPIRDALTEAEGSGGTAVADGVFSAMMVGEGDVGRALVIVFSDGVDTASWLTADRVRDAAKRSDAVIYGVCVQSRIKPELLADLASLTGGRLHEIEKTQNLAQTFLAILEEFRIRYLVSYTPAGVAREGWHKLEVRIKGRRATVRARPGYLAGF